MDSSRDRYCVFDSRCVGWRERFSVSKGKRLSGTARAGKGTAEGEASDKGTRCTKKGTDCCAGEKISSGGAAGEIGRRKKLYYQEISGRK